MVKVGWDEGRRLQTERRNDGIFHRKGGDDMNRLHVGGFLLLLSTLLSACMSSTNVDIGENWVDYEESMPSSLTIEIVERYKSSNNLLVQKIMDLASKYPALEVNIRSTPNAVESQTPWMFGREGVGDPPDLIELTPNQMKIWFYHGKLEALGISEPQYQDYVIHSSDGYSLGVMTKINPLIVYYNQEIFRRHGLEPPSEDWDWQQFEHVISILKEAGENVYILMTPYLLEWVTINHYNGQIADPSGMAFGGYLDSAEAIQAAEWILGVDTQYEDYKNRGSEQQPLISPIPLDLIEDNMALAVDYAYYLQSAGITNYETIIQRNNRIGIAPLPGGSDVVNPAHISGLAMLSSSKNKESAMTFLRYMLEESADFYRDTMIQTHHAGATEELPSETSEGWKVLMQEARRSVPASLLMVQDQMQWGNRIRFFPPYHAMKAGQSAKDALMQYAEVIDLQFDDFYTDLEYFSLCMKQRSGVCW